MPCDSNCKSYLKSTVNTVVSGRMLMIGDVYCRKAKRKLTTAEASAPLASPWCPNGIDKGCEMPGESITIPGAVEARIKRPAACQLCQDAPDVNTRTKKQAVPQKLNHTAMPMPDVDVDFADKTAPSGKRLGHVQNLVARLNQYHDEYYNKNAPTISDAAYDRLVVELRQLEQETGYVMSNSPTQTVGFKAVSSLEKTTHSIPLLSLDDTKDINAIHAFVGSQPFLLMYKLDGLTIKLEYENGELAQTSTRGDGNEGEVVTHNAPAISGIPQRIPYKQRLVVVGEAFIHQSDFEAIQKTLLDSSGKPYKNGRNLAAGSVRCFDAADCVKRLVHFTPFNVLEGLNEDPVMANSKSAKLTRLVDFGFSLCGFKHIAEPHFSVDFYKSRQMRFVRQQGMRISLSTGLSLHLTTLRFPSLAAEQVIIIKTGSH